MVIVQQVLAAVAYDIRRVDKYAEDFVTDKSGLRFAKVQISFRNSNSDGVAITRCRPHIQLAFPAF